MLPLEDELYGKHGPYVAALARRWTSRPTDAADLTQDVFVEALRSWDRLRDHGALRAWLRGITRNLARHRWRSQKLRQTQALPAELTCPGPDPESYLLARDVTNILSALPARCRDSWLQRKVEGVALPEIARRLGCSLPTVKRAIAQTQSLLRQRLSPTELQALTPARRPASAEESRSVLARSLGEPPAAVSSRHRPGWSKLARAQHLRAGQPQVDQVPASMGDPRQDEPLRDTKLSVA